MNSAEYKCAREYLGLTPDWIGHQLGKTARYVASWEEPGRSVPDYAAEFIEQQLDVAAQTVGALTVKWREKHGDSAIPVPAGNGRSGEMPPAYHRQIASRVRERIGIDIEYQN